MQKNHVPKSLSFRMKNNLKGSPCGSHMDFFQKLKYIKVDGLSGLRVSFHVDGLPIIY